MNKHQTNFIISLEKHLKNKDKKKLNELVAKIHCVDLADILSRFEISLIICFFSLVNVECSALTLVELNPLLRNKLISALDDSIVKKLFANLALDDQIDIIKNLEKEVQKQIIGLMEDQDKIEGAIAFGLNAVASKMTKDFVKVFKEDTVEDAAEKIREQNKWAEKVHYVYIVDDNDKLSGVISLQELFLARPKEKIKDIIKNENIIFVNLDTDQEKAANLMAKYDLIVLPVVDNEGIIKGVLTIDDIIDVIQEEGTEDIFKQAGFTKVEEQQTDYSSKLIFGSVANVVRVRFPWLFIVLVGGLLAGGVISGFEETLDSIVVLAFFIPVIMDMGGNVGTQSSTIFVRGVVLGHIDVQAFFKHFKRELVVGILIGLLSALLLSLSTYLWQRQLVLALVTGFSMFFTVVLASIIGFIIPWLMMKTGFDSAAASDPLITTIKDITGLIIYFSIANMFINYLI